MGKEQLELILYNVNYHFTCNGKIKQSIMAVVNVLSLVSTALCRKQTRVRAVPISLDAPAIKTQIIT